MLYLREDLFDSFAEDVIEQTEIYVENFGELDGWMAVNLYPDKSTDTIYIADKPHPVANALATVWLPRSDISFDVEEFFGNSLTRLAEIDPDAVRAYKKFKKSGDFDGETFWQWLVDIPSDFDATPFIDYAHDEIMDDFSANIAEILANDGIACDDEAPENLLLSLPEDCDYIAFDEANWWDELGEIHPIIL